MKKVLLILLAFLPVLMYADECSDAYKAGLSLYKNKKYVEAQSKFIAVVSKCNSYADVLSMLKVCNEKIKEEQAKQTKQIATLEIENRQLRNAANQAKAENTSTTRGEEAVLTINSTRKKLNEDLEVTRKDLQIANDSIVSLNHTIKHLNDSIVSLNKSLQSAHTTIDEQNKKISSLTQPKDDRIVRIALLTLQ